MSQTGGGRHLAVCLNPTIQRTLVLERLRPGHVNRVRELSLDAAGKGINVSRVLVQLGEPVVQLTQAGGHDRELFLGLARRDGIEVAPVDTQADVRTCITLLDRQQRTTTEIVEEGRPVDAATERAIREAYRRLVPDCRTVVISGTKAPGFSPQLYPWMAAEARACGKTVIVDYRGEDLVATIPSRPTVVKVNFTEFVATFFPDEDAAEDAGSDRLLARVRERMLRLLRDDGIVTVLTRGRLSTLYVDGGAVAERQPPAAEAVNTTGCGDAFAAGMAATLGRGLGIEAAVAAGHDCAARNAALLRPGVIR